ncbi:MAG: preprotein translocase subunit SecE, partial [Oscillospiraceae bacterium]|nr:preprotein translocase subunit SecE [Oscillospiraceae bacterium]
VARWFREMKSELKKVVWPTPKQIVNNTLVSLAVMAVSAVVVWGVDQVGAQIFRMLITLGG